MSNSQGVSKYEYWKLQFTKLENEYHLAVKERRVKKFLKENHDRINGLFQLRLNVGFETFNQLTQRRSG